MSALLLPTLGLVAVKCPDIIPDEFSDIDPDLLLICGSHQPWIIEKGGQFEIGRRSEAFEDEVAEGFGEPGADPADKRFVGVHGVFIEPFAGVDGGFFKEYEQCPIPADGCIVFEDIVFQEVFKIIDNVIFAMGSAQDLKVVSLVQFEFSEQLFAGELDGLFIERLRYSFAEERGWGKI
jgi:hypothetical protein